MKKIKKIKNFKNFGETMKKENQRATLTYHMQKAAELLAKGVFTKEQYEMSIAESKKAIYSR